MFNLPYSNSKVTVELRDVVESGVKVWDFEYPSYYQGEAKTAFEKKVLDHYWFRQIGQETVGRWLHMFRTRVREIMPLYLQYYHSVELMEAQEDPFEAYNLTETLEKNTRSSGTSRNTGSASTENGETNTREHRFSNTPQGSLDNLDNYLTEASKDTDTNAHNGTASSESESESTGEGSESYTLTRKGNIGVQPLGKEVQALRDSYINVDMMIIDELNDLFLGIY